MPELPQTARVRLVLHIETEIPTERLLQIAKEHDKPLYYAQLAELMPDVETRTFCIGPISMPLLQVAHEALEAVPDRVFPIAVIANTAP